MRVLSLLNPIHMKQLCIIAILMLLNLFSSYAQTPQATKPSEKVTYTCDSMKTDKDPNVMILLGNVNLQAGKLKISKGEKVVWDTAKQKLIAYNPGTFTFDGEVVVSKDAKQEGTLEYKIGEDRLYLK